MAEAIQIKDITEAISARRFPSVTIWNRLEGRPRTAAFDRALRAEVRDALWFLSRQWQLGEFHGARLLPQVDHRVAVTADGQR